MTPRQIDNASLTDALDSESVSAIGRLPWWTPLAGVGLLMLASALVSLVDGPIPPTKFGNAAEWATAYGTVAAISLALAQRGEQEKRRQRAVVKGRERERRLATLLDFQSDVLAVKDLALNLDFRSADLDGPGLMECVVALDAAIRSVEPYGFAGHRAEVTRLMNLVTAVQTRPTSENQRRSAQQLRSAVIEKADKLTDQVRELVGDT